MTITLGIKLSCILNKEDGKTTITLAWVNKKGSIIKHLEFADITYLFRDYQITNDTLQVYDNFEDFEKDFLRAMLGRFVGKPIKLKKLDYLVKTHAKIIHKNGTCMTDCALCNPDITPRDYFPDFNFDARCSDEENSH